MGKKCEGVCVPCECSLKSDLSEEDFNCQVNRMIHSGDTIQPLFLANPIITQWAYEQHGYGGRDRIYAWAQQHGPPLTKVKLDMAIIECLVPQQKGLTLSS